MNNSKGINMHTTEIDVNIMLKDVDAISSKYDLLASETGDNFNIFEITGIGIDERKVCRLMYELLSPEGRHGQKDTYLKMFLIDCLKFEFTEYEISKAIVHQEYYTGRFIDIVIEIGSSFIPIEVKLYAGDQMRQGFDYLGYAKAKEKEAKLVYLTLDGRAPSINSTFTLDEKDILLLSFEADILGWIEKCIALQDTIRKAPIREILIQFASEIKRITNQLEDKPKMDVMNLLSDSPDNMRNADIIANSLNLCKADLLIKLFKGIEEGIGRKAHLVHDYEPSAKRYYNQKKSTWPAISYQYINVKPNVDIWFRIEIGFDWLYAGLCVAVNNENQGWVLSTKESNKLNIAQDLSENNWWSTKWVYLPDGNQNVNDRENPNFKNHNDAYYKLYSKAHFNEFVDKCVILINEMWEKWACEMEIQSPE
jgi:hypothetical protein